MFLNTLFSLYVVRFVYKSLYPHLCTCLLFSSLWASSNSISFSLHPFFFFSLSLFFFSLWALFSLSFVRWDRHRNRRWLLCQRVSARLGEGSVWRARCALQSRGTWTRSSTTRTCRARAAALPRRVRPRRGAAALRASCSRRRSRTAPACASWSTAVSSRCARRGPRRRARSRPSSSTSRTSSGTRTRSSQLSAPSSRTGTPRAFSRNPSTPSFAIFLPPPPPSKKPPALSLWC